MDQKRLLIAGIDPGITTAYAILDIEGNPIHLNSSKQLSLNSIISETIKFGRVVLVGTDKSKVPWLVESFATKVGARIISPKEDLKVDEKRNMTKNLSFNDEHQSDALASALFAYKSSRPLLDKINFFAGKNKKHSIKDRIKEIVVTKGISIRSAVGIIEKKHEEDKIIEKVIFERKISENDFLKVYNKLKEYESEINLLRGYNNKLNKRINEIEKHGAKRPEPGLINSKTPDFREKRIKFLENIVKSKEDDMIFFKSVVAKLNGIISGINNYYILKKLDTLGIKEFNFKNRVLNINRNDMILVDDPNIYSSETIELLKDVVFVVVHKKPISEKVRNNLPFVFLNSKTLKIIEDKYVGFVGKNYLEAEKSKVDWVRKVVNDYRLEKNLISR